MNFEKKEKKLYPRSSQENMQQQQIFMYRHEAVALRF